MQTAPTTLFSAPDLARELGCPDSVETIYRILGHLAANGRAVYHPGPDPTLSLFGFAPATYSQ